MEKWEGGGVEKTTNRRRGYQKTGRRTAAGGGGGGGVCKTPFPKLVHPSLPQGSAEEEGGRERDRIQFGQRAKHSLLRVISKVNSTPQRVCVEPPRPYRMEGVATYHTLLLKRRHADDTLQSNISGRL